ncbi:hypothetical protein WICMUC_004601 [Wickerhamomyces mucosus]|uniref:Luciferase-like domain-containing protein n=1 Tax=Wickerhamomyces mucosus TaxID=1378264 RepID=A0A9P8PHF7_9ASCO|nr:hypothetical protein WICMUC_004601 [Wickerhamomyces mucosus]
MMSSTKTQFNHEGLKNKSIEDNDHDIPSTISSKRKDLIINFFIQGCVTSQPSGLWSFPGDQSRNYKKLSFWTDLAKKAEANGINGIFIADVLGPYDQYKGPGNFETGVKAATQHPGIDPSIPISAMASVTKNVGFGITFSTISEHPYLFARRLSSLDHFTNGRVGWNIVSSYLNSASLNLLNGVQLPEKTKRYEKTEEYVQIINELLLSSFRTDSILIDEKTKTYADPKLVRKIDYEGEFYTVPGPAYTEPSPQGIPVLFQAGQSPSGIELAAKHAEVAFMNESEPKRLKVNVDKYKEIAIKRYNRNPKHLKVIFLAMVIVAETEEKAWEKFEYYSKFADPEGALSLVSGWTGADFSIYDDEIDLTTVDNQQHREIVKGFCKKIYREGIPINKSQFAKFVSVKGSTNLIIGSVEDVIEELITWVDESGIDGFNFAPVTIPGSYDDLIEYVLPQLKKRGYFSGNYKVPNGTFRENLYGNKGQSFLPEDHPDFKYRWSSGSSEKFASKLAQHREHLRKRAKIDLNSNSIDDV